MEKKDYFARQSKAYAAFRPTYPQELYHFIFKHLKGKECAWDCATGNGQAAQHLAKHFQSVYATDISPQQLSNAFPAENIFYSVSAAEQTAFSDQQFDLITVAQALHWINLDLFYKEVRRTGKPGSLLAVWGYGLLHINEELDELVCNFYHHRVGPYWDAARRMVENHYADLRFPFEIIECPAFSITAHWNLEQFLGYLTSWSATQKFMLDQATDPVEGFATSVQPLWEPGTVKQVTFPVFMKLGRI